MGRLRKVVRIGAVAAASLAISMATVLPAVANPATSIAYPNGSTNTRYVGKAFDACTAPSLATIQKWSASPYRALGVYVGGNSRTCTQPNLTAAWVTAVTKMGWRLIPIYKGAQPTCGGRVTDPKIIPSTAAAQGKASADDMIGKANALGMVAGSGFYLDIEAYSRTDATCRTAVLTFESAWTKQLHARGYLSGLYLNLLNGAADTAAVYNSTTYARPDAIWVARYDLSTSLTNWTGIPNSYWAVHQRAKQYRGSHDETYGGATLNIDNDYFDAPVATVRYSYKVTSTVPLNARTGPSTTYPVVRQYSSGSSLSVLCQTTGQTISTTSVWDRLSDGSYVSDYYVSTPSSTGFSAPLPRCNYGYQISGASSVNLRSGPGTTYPIVGTIPEGGLAAVTCQKSGALVLTTRIWDRLDNAKWVSDYYVVNPSNTTYSGPAQRC